MSGNFENYSKSQVGSKILQVSENLKKNCHGCLSLLDNLFLFAGSCRPLEYVSTLLFCNCWVNKWWCYEFLKNLIKILKNWQSVKILKIWLSPRSVENYSKCQKIWKLFKVWVESCFYLWNIAVWKVVKVCNCLIKILLKFWKFWRKFWKSLKIALSVRKIWKLL